MLVFERKKLSIDYSETTSERDARERRSPESSKQNQKLRKKKRDSRDPGLGPFLSLVAYSRVVAGEVKSRDEPGY